MIYDESPSHLSVDDICKYKYKTTDKKYGLHLYTVCHITNQRSGVLKNCIYNYIYIYIYVCVFAHVC